MPDAELSGQHRVRLGSSFTTTHAQESDAYVAFRYNFQPSTIDGSRPSTLQGGSVDGSGEYILSTPSKESREARHVFKGAQTAQKDIDCLLIYDESSDSYRLEKLGSVIRFDHQRQTIAAPGHTRAEPEEVIEKDETRETAKVESNQTHSSVPSLENDEVVSRAEKPKAETVTRRKSTDSTRKVERQAESRPIEKLQTSRPVEQTLSMSKAVAEEEDEAEDEEADDDDEEDDGELDDLANMLESTLEETNPKMPSHSSGARLDSGRSISALPLVDESSEDED